MTMILNPNKDWYEDGIAKGKHGWEQLWRLDVNQHIQVQFFATPVGHEDKSGQWVWDGPPNTYSKARLFIERDTRELRGPKGRQESVRVYYACDCWDITNDDAANILNASKEQAEVLLAEKIAHVMGLPSSLTA